MKLWGHQERALTLIREAFASGKRRICVVSPTGSGKGTLAAEILKLTVQKGGKGLFIVHRREIILDQAQRLAVLGLNVGVILPDHDSRPYADVQVASTNTLLNRMDRLPEASVIVTDECHHYASKEWSRLLSAYSNSIVIEFETRTEPTIIGLTATPERGDGKPLSQFEHLIEAAKYSELIRQGLIVPCRVYQPSAHMGSNLATDPVAAYQQYAPGTKGFCFVSTLDLARDVTRRFKEAGIPAEAIEGKTAKRTRDRAIQQLRSGELMMLVNYNTLTEGVDVPDAQTCILARACGHTGTYLQCVGRILRSAPGKRFGILLDLVGASLVHGLPHIDRSYSLDGKAFDSSNLPPLTVCVGCGLTQLAGRTSCEGCGFVFLRHERKRPLIYSETLNEVYQWEDTPEAAKVDEFLRLVDQSAERGYSIDWVVKCYQELFGAKPPVTWLAELPEARKRKEYDQWRSYGESRGFKPGYAWARYNEAFGCSPPRAWMKGAA